MEAELQQASAHSVSSTLIDDVIDKEDAIQVYVRQVGNSNMIASR